MVNPIQITQPQAYSGGADFSPLAGLYDTYKAAQARATQETALGQLGTDPTSNIGVLLQSRDPKLVHLGLQLQEQQAAGGRSDAYLKLQQNAANRIEEDRALAEKNRLAAPGLYERMLGGGGASTGAPSGPAPFPAALPSLSTLQPSTPPVQPSPAPPLAPPAPAGPSRFAGPPAPPISGPQDFSVTGAPPLAAPPLEPTAIPVKAEGGDTGLPDWAGPQSLAGRMAGTLAAGRPAAAAGISNKDLGAALANPETRALATVFAQNRIDPGTWDVHFDNDTGRAIAVNKRTLESRDVTPATPGGEPPMSKQEREVQGWKRAGAALGMNEEDQNAFASHKGVAGKDALPVHDRKVIDDNDNAIMSAGTAIDNLNRLEQLSKTAFSGFGALQRAAVAGQTGRGGGTDTLEYENIAKKNVVNMAKAAFPRPTGYETQLLEKIETSATMPQAEREDLIKDFKKQLLVRAKELQFKTDAILGKKYYTAGGGSNMLDTFTSAASGTPSGSTASAEKTVVRTGTVNSGQNKGKTAVQYSDGSIEYR